MSRGKRRRARAVALCGGAGSRVLAVEEGGRARARGLALLEDGIALGQ